MLWMIYHNIEIWSAMILNIMMNKSILEVDDIEVCSAEVLKFCTSLAPKIPSNPWQNIANITGNFLIVVSTSFVVVLLTMYRKRKEFRFEMVNLFLIFFSFWFEIIFGSKILQKCTWLTGLTTVWGVTVPKLLPFQAFFDTSTETWKNWIENMKKKIVSTFEEYVCWGVGDQHGRT